MSDPVTQAEIEDVLSSIRRLVSEDGRSGPGQAPAQSPVQGMDHGTAAQAVPPSSEHQVAAKPNTRLVLTPALRVADDLSTPSPAPAEPSAPTGDTGIDPASFEAETDFAAQDDSPIDLDVDPLEDPAEVLAFHAQAGAEDLSSAAHDEGAPQEGFTRGEGEGQEAGADPAGLDASTSDQVEAAPWRDPEATLFGVAEGQVQEVAQDGAQEWEQDVAPDLGPELADTPAQPTAEMAEPEVWHAPEDDVELDGSQKVSAVVQKIAELEAKVARSEGQWEPDGNSRDPYAGTNIETLEWQDHEAAEFEEVEQPGSGAAEESLDAATLTEEAVTDATLDSLGATGNEDSYLDEDSLRELVADIVRSELQGALGERITRNVRKLVRREIHRALAAQDLI